MVHLQFTPVSTSVTDTLTVVYAGWLCLVLLLH